jgi:hypothetical protein
VSRFLASYLAGDYVPVWNEMRRLPPLSPPPGPVPLLQAVDRFLDEHAALVRDVEAVCCETMRRVRANLEMIVSRLDAGGYIFHDFCEQSFTPLAGPERDSEELVRLVEATFGPLPRSVKAFITVVGEVCLLGNHPMWGIEYPPKGPSLFVFSPNPPITRMESSGETVIWYPDPLVVEFRYSRKRLSLDEVMFHYEEMNRIDESGPSRLEFSADAVHKAGYSGGTPYYVHLPDGRADGSVTLDVKGETYFVDYLRHAILDWGGFPGFEEAPTGRDHGLVAELKRELFPF